MAVWKGGRGAKAPYETTHVRIPVDIKEKVEAISQAYKDGTLGSPEIDFEKAELKARIEELETLLTLNEAIEKARELLKNKKSVKIKMESLLTAIYGENVSL